MRKVFLTFCSIIFIFTFSFAALPAEPTSVPAVQKCEGPVELCSQIVDLKKKLADQKSLSDQKALEKSDEVKKKEKESSERTMKVIAAASMIAVALKILLSLLKSWKGYFTTDKGKAWLRVSTLIIGLLAFILTNIGFGMTWVESLILAGGGPGAILVHELQKLIPVLRGKEKMPPSDEDGGIGTEKPAKKA